MTYTQILNKTAKRRKWHQWINPFSRYAPDAIRLVAKLPGEIDNPAHGGGGYIPNGYQPGGAITNDGVSGGNTMPIAPPPKTVYPRPKFSEDNEKLLSWLDTMGLKYDILHPKEIPSDSYLDYQKRWINEYLKDTNSYLYDYAKSKNITGPVLEGGVKFNNSYSGIIETLNKLYNPNNDPKIAQIIDQRLAYQMKNRAKAWGKQHKPGQLYSMDYRMGVKPMDINPDINPTDWNTYPRYNIFNVARSWSSDISKIGPFLLTHPGLLGPIGYNPSWYRETIIHEGVPGTGHLHTLGNIYGDTESPNNYVFLGAKHGDEGSLAALGDFTVNGANRPHGYINSAVELSGFLNRLQNNMMPMGIHAKGLKLDYWNRDRSKVDNTEGMELQDALVKAGYLVPTYFGGIKQFTYNDQPKSIDSLDPRVQEAVRRGIRPTELKTFTHMLNRVYYLQNKIDKGEYTKEDAMELYRAIKILEGYSLQTNSAPAQQKQLYRYTFGNTPVVHG